MSNKFVDLNDEILLKYFKDIKKTDLLTQEEELNLAIRIQNGDEKAIGELVSANLKFVISIAKEYRYQGTPLNDLIGDGNEGLIKAALKFDHTKGFRFISYAVWWVRQSILHGLNCNSRLIRLPANVINSLLKIKKEIENFELENGKYPINDETNNSNLVDLLNNQKPISLNTIINEDGDELCQSFPDYTFDSPDYDDTGDKLIKNELDRMLSELSYRERDILISYFGLNSNYEPMTLEDIGEKYDLTKERIRQIKMKAIRKLRYNMGDYIP